MRLRAVWLCTVLAGSILGTTRPHRTAAQEPAAEQPQVASASDEAQRAIAGFRVPEGFRLELAAAEPLVANPVAFCLDERGRIYVAESFRQGHGIEDNRDHMDWLDEDLAAQSVADRLEMFRNHLGDRLSEYAAHDDRIRLLTDGDGDGRFERSVVFAEGFNDILAGTGAGVLARRGDVYYTCIPDLWLLRDPTGADRANERISLHSGYGVRVAFRGHDLHGLRFGPDGRLYFSIGDRGLHVETPEGTLHYPESGCVLRCNPDGSELEIVHSGLRNPQELAFDELGNLFTCDNNSDSGDRARWVLIQEGADSGWRMAYQYLPDRGPWNRERIWEPQCDGQPASILPPLLNLADGPSGLTYAPGTGFPGDCQGCFYLCDFRGTAGNSGIRQIRVQPRGAAFEVVENREFLWSILATDCDFGPDGALYVSDWVDGWYGPGKGRIYRLVAEDAAEKLPLGSAAELLAASAGGFAEHAHEELLQLLRHPDQRVRQEAQFTLAERGAETAPGLLAVTQDPSHLLARVHAIWALGQLGRQDADVLEQVVPLLTDAEPEVRAQAARVLGERRQSRDAAALLPLLEDDNLRVRQFAALALARCAAEQDPEPLVRLLRGNGDADVYLRHAGVLALERCAADDALVTLLNDPSPSVRLAAVLALRRRGSERLAPALHDAEPRVAAEAARAIYDLPLEGALPALAALTDQGALPEPIFRRALHAAFRLGRPEDAQRLAAAAGSATLSEPLRLEALELLTKWPSPGGRDLFLGLWRPLGDRDVAPLKAAVLASLGGMLGGPESVAERAIDLAAQLDLGEVGPVLRQTFDDGAQPTPLRAEALAALVRLHDPAARDVLELGSADSHPLVRAAALRAWATFDPQASLPLLETAIVSGSPLEQRTAYEALARVPGDESDRLLCAALDQLASGTLAAYLQLDVVEAAAERATPSVRERLAAWEAVLDPADPLARYRIALEGGDAGRGQRLFFERAELSCVRCHRVGERGGLVGPELTRIAEQKSAEYLLEAIVAPNRQIAQNFETAVLLLDDGRTAIGIVKRETETEIELVTAEGQILQIDTASIEERSRGQSAMPDKLLEHLSRRDLRDLVAYLKSLRATPPPPSAGEQQP